MKKNNRRRTSTHWGKCPFQRTRPPNNPPLLLLPTLLLFSLFLGVAPLASPPSYSRDAMPVTSFTCDGRASGGYFADHEAQCQMFHVCVRVSEEEVNDHRFLCPNNTIFDQMNFICASWWETECKAPETTSGKEKALDPWGLTSTSSTASPSSTAPVDDVRLHYETNEQQVDSYDYPAYESARDGRSRNFETNPILGRSVVQPLTNSQNSLPQHESKEKIVSTSEKTTSAAIPTTEPTAFNHAFEASFAVGKPVVSISSTSSRLEISSPRYEESTPKYGYFSVQQPSTTPEYPKMKLSSPHYEKSTTTPIKVTTPKALVKPLPPQEHYTTQKPSVYANVKEFKASDLSSVPDSEDPFAYIDWQRDSTPSKSYSFSSTSEKSISSPQVKAIGRRRKVVPKPVLIKSPSKSTSKNSSARVTATRVSSSSRPRLLKNGSLGGRRRARQRAKPGEPTVKPRRIFTGPSRQDFSRFRYFKTAFGDSGSPRRSRSGLSTRGERLSRRTLGVERPKTASRNTRYSIYAE